MLTQRAGCQIVVRQPRAAEEEPETALLPEVTEKVAEMPPYKVILHNDEVNDITHVVITILKLTPLKHEEAIERTWEAHEEGHSVLLVTHRERAELYVDQFKTFQLTVTCEPA